MKESFKGILTAFAYENFRLGFDLFDTFGSERDICSPGLFTAYEIALEDEL